MKVTTSNLIGAALDWAVAVCEGYTNYCPDTEKFLPPHEGYGYVPLFDLNFSTDWAQAGPIIERECIGTLFDSGSACRKPCWFATPDDQSTSCSYEGEVFDPTFMVTESVGMYGPTPLIAAMRCLVASKLGDTVEIPDGL
jgi:hypothetical protein